MKQRFLFSFALLLSSFLLFMSEPMIAKAILPHFGGSKNVWNVCLVFYELTLLLGYAYANFLREKINTRASRQFNFVLIGLAVAFFLPLKVYIPENVISSPILSAFIVLVKSIFVPFFILSAASPLLQSYFATSGNFESENPYFLYRASNFGSFAALICYPFFLEPHFDLTFICLIWSILFLFVSFLFLQRQNEGDRISLSKNEDVLSEIHLKQKIMWIVLSFVPSALLTCVTAILTSDIAPMPLLWIVPLSIYLLSFGVAFTDTAVRLKKIVSDFHLVFVSMLILFRASTNQQLFVLLPFNLIAFGAISLWCHLRLYEIRPNSKYLTSFYLYSSLGGVFGGIFSAIIAPYCFDEMWEYGILIVIALLLRNYFSHSFKDWLKFILLLILYFVFLLFIIFYNSSSFSSQDLFFVSSAFFLICNYCLFRKKTILCAFTALVVLLGGRWYFAATEKYTVDFVSRDFYGNYKVITKDERYRFLQHGNIYHGVVDLKNPETGLAYYSESSPVALFFRRSASLKQLFSNTALIGLGVGSILCYGSPDQKWDIFELDESIVELSTKKNLFPILKKCAPDAEIIIGDGRISLSNIKKKYDVIIVDVFSSDSIPVHLLTKEAVKEYLSHLTDNGVVLFHISNNYVDIESIIGAVAENLNADMAVKDDFGHDGDLYIFNSSWAAIAKGHLPQNIFYDFHKPVINRDIGVFTDNYSSIYKAFKFKVKRRSLGI